MSFERKATFEICGAVVRKPFVAPSGKFARVTLATPGRSGEKKTDVRAFDGEIIREIADLGVGQTVRVTGDVDSEKLTNKAKQEVVVDGYTAWQTVLTARWLQVEGSSKAPPPEPGAKANPAPKSKAKGWGDDEPPPPSDDDIPF